ncbi:MAG: hypothetical protein RRA32_00165 [bacterium]|nr:hypothetical protein [bacterium]
MTWYLYIVALMFIVTGSFLILDTDKARELSQSWLESGNYRLWGVVAAVLGILLAVASFWSGVVWFLFLLGLLVGGMGIFIFVGKEAKVAPLIRTWGSISDRGLRLWGLILVVTGTAILSWV